MNWYLNNAGYLQGYIKGKRWSQHRYVWTQHNGPIADGMVIHHINGVKTDNNIDNLALVTRTQNEQKMDKARKGYYYDKVRNKYLAQRKVNGVTKFIGRFATECGAYIASRMAYITHS